MLIFSILAIWSSFGLLLLLLTADEIDEPLRWTGVVWLFLCGFIGWLVLLSLHLGGHWDEDSF